ncbi:MAG: HAMP domain-containing histidine kinase [Methylococcales bacterium]|nr:HAMP domain-containing histidine kinase [Methylococcales bacterium]
MTEKNPEIIYPCPLSKDYGIPAQQAWMLLKVFLAYRLTLATLFISLFYTQTGSSLLSIDHSPLFTYSSQCYLMLSIISAVCIMGRLTSYTIQAQLLIITDIIILTLIMHAYGGISSGIGVLLAVSIASGGLLIGGRCAMFFAALASVAVLAEQLYASYMNSFDITPYAYFYAGMLGASFFTISLLSFVLAKRSEQMLQVSNQQQAVISNLEELNQYIIQHLQSGIMIANQQQIIQLANEAVLRLMNLVNLPLKLSDISVVLETGFLAWLANNEQDFLVLQVADQSDVHVRFTRLPTGHKFFYMITFEYGSLYNQRVQQSKLASLGRLTASIAHEIRNPLSAINHAGQLLSENSDLPAQDVRLTHIIQINAARVNHIIEDILQLSRRKDSRREKIDLNLWCDRYLKNFMSEQDIAADAFTLVTSNEPLFVCIDPSHLKQIMDNLCQNALKYGQPEAGAIKLQTRMLKQTPCIYVIDNGLGVSREHLRHLFEPFFTTSASGTGLGLYISRELAELNQAKLIYYVTDENNSCFRLCLFNANHTLIER